MIARMVAILVILVTLAPVNVPSAQASEESVVVANSFFTALNAGDLEAAVVTFSPDAVATLARGETYRGQNGFHDLVELMDHPGRRYEIVQANVAGDTVTMDVDVSDHGIRWGQTTIVVEVRGGKVHAFHETSFHLRPGS